MRKMYSKGQIKSLGNGYRHLIQIGTADTYYIIDVCLHTNSISSIDDLPEGLYLGLKERLYPGVLDLNTGINWCDADGSKPIAVTSIVDTLLD